jgi:hypothetical protein
MVGSHDRSDEQTMQTCLIITYVNWMCIKALAFPRFPVIAYIEVNRQLLSPRTIYSNFKSWSFRLKVTLQVFDIFLQ